MSAVHVTVNAPTAEVAKQIVALQLNRDGRVGYRVTGAIEADEQRPNSEVALYAMTGGRTYVVTVERPALVTKRTCPECGRVFDLTDPTDAAESAYGHDCEAS